MGPNMLAFHAREETHRFREIDVVADMAIFIETSAIGADGKATIGGEMLFWYMCRHLQPNGDCGIYDRRPEMCSTYPYGVPCKYTDCTWDDGRAGAHPPPPLWAKELVQIGLPP